MLKQKCNHCGVGEAEYCKTCFEGLLNQVLDLEVKSQAEPTKDTLKGDIERLMKQIKRVEFENFSLRLTHVNDVKTINENFIPKSKIKAKIIELEKLQKYCAVDELRSSEDQIDILKEILGESQ